jgi:hypothetical protein
MSDPVFSYNNITIASSMKFITEIMYQYRYREFRGSGSGIR